jgi:hypothetical protein
MEPAAPLRIPVLGFGPHRAGNRDPDNLASIRLLQKVGMRYEGRLMESLRLKGQWVSEDWYANSKTYGKMTTV